MAISKQILPDKGYRVPNPNAEFSSEIGKYDCTGFDLSAESLDRSAFPTLDTPSIFQPVGPSNSLELFL